MSAHQWEVTDRDLVFPKDPTRVIYRWKCKECGSTGSSHSAKYVPRFSNPSSNICEIVIVRKIMES